MRKTIILAVASMFTMVGVAQSQTLGANAPDYNAPYDTLVARGDKGAYSGKMIGASTPGLAMMFYNRAIEINKERHEAYLGKGNAYMDYNMLDEALENFNTCLEVSPDNPACLYGVFYTSFLGSKRENINDVPKPMMNQIYNSAVAFLAVAPEEMRQEKANAKIIGYVMKLGMDNKDLFTKFNANNTNEIKEENAKVLEEILAPVIATNNVYITMAIYDNLIEYYFNLGNYAKVKEYGMKAFAAGEAFTNTYFYLAHTLYYQDKNVAEAEKVIAAGEKYSPNNRSLNLKLNLYYTEGTTAYKAKDYVKAISYLKKYTEINKTGERALAYLGFANYASKKYPDAAKALKELKKVAAPETSKIYYPNLDALIAFSEKPGATAPAIQTTLIEVEKQEAALDKAIALTDSEKYDESIQAMAAPILYFEQTKDPINLSWAYMNLAFNYHNSKNYELAKENYRKSIAAGGYQDNAYNNLGLLVFGVDKNAAEAEKILLEGIAKHPDSDGISSRLSKLYAAQGDDAFDAKDYTTSIAKYSKALEYRGTADIYTFLGFSYYYTQENEKCIEALENAVYMDPEITTTYPAINQVLNALK